MTVLGEIRASIRQHAEGAGSPVAGIGQRWGAGSGVVLAGGRVLASAHNVRGGQVTVTFAGGRMAGGSVAGQDIDGGLAVIEVGTGGAPALARAGGASAATGTPVFALSSPGGRGLRVTSGFVCGVDRAFQGPRGRRITGSLEHTATLLPGSSGGPVPDAGGRLPGIKYEPPRRGLLPGHTRRRGAAGPGGCARPRRVSGATAAWHRHRPRRVARRLRRAAGLPGHPRGCSSSRSPRIVPPPAAASPRAA